MKNLIALSILLLTVELLAADYNKASLLYKSGNYSEAVLEYETLLKQYPASADLWYNLGNSYFKSGTLGKSILCYEKALKLQPDDDEIIHNLSLANSRKADVVKVVPKPAIVNWLYSFFQGADIYKWFRYGAVLVWVSAICFILFFFSSTAKNILKNSGIMFLIAAMFFVCMGLLHFRNYIKNVEGILISANVYVKSAPDNKAQDLFIIHEGLKMDILDEVNEWSKVKLQDGKTGWVQKKNIEKI